MPNRYDYLDVAKGIGILLVVWAHILVVGWSHRVIYAFHMPLFFFISGMLFNKDKYSSFYQFIAARAKRLLIPYLIYSIASWALWAGFRFVRGDEVVNYWTPLLQIILAKGSGAFIVYNSALWFIPCLFAVEIIYYFFSRFNKWVTLFLCLLSAVVGCFFMYKYGDDYLFSLPWNLDAALYALLFYGAANFIMQHITHKQMMNYISNNKVASLLVIITMFGIMTFLALNFGECSMGASSYQCPLWCFFVRAFFGCFAMVLLCAVVGSFGLNLRTLIWCGKNSLDIMSLHIPIKGVVIILISMLLHPTIDVECSFLHSSFAFILTMITITLIIVLINSFVKKHNSYNIKTLFV